MAFDAFLKIAEIDGESTDKKYEKHIEIMSFSFGASNQVSLDSGTGGGGSGKVNISSFNIMKKTDKASPKLFQMCCSGEHKPTAKVILRKAGGKNALEYIKYDFDKVFVDSIQWSGSGMGGDDTPTESVSFAYGAVKIAYNPQKPDGTGEGEIEAMWSITKNEASDKA